MSVYALCICIHRIFLSLQNLTVEPELEAMILQENDTEGMEKKLNQDFDY